MGMMTGRHQVRFGIEGPLQGTQLRYRSTRLCSRKRLKKLGYTTGLMGKWHLVPTTPCDADFDEFYGIHHGGHSFLPTSKQPISMRGSRRSPSDLTLHSGGKLSILWIATIALLSSFACRSRRCTNHSKPPRPT